VHESKEAVKVIIAGSRSIVDKEVVERAVRESGFRITEVISGGARGVDALGEEIARDLGVPVQRFLPAWDVYGKAAGAIRNEAMAKVADALIAVWDGKSGGTRNMMWQARRRGLQVYVCRC